MVVLRVTTALAVVLQTGKPALALVTTSTHLDLLAGRLSKSQSLLVATVGKC